MSQRSCEKLGDGDGGRGAGCQALRERDRADAVVASRRSRRLASHSGTQSNRPARGAGAVERAGQPLTRLPESAIHQAAAARVTAPAQLARRSCTDGPVTRAR